jgi:CheY-like chemotaxis protein
MKAQKDFAIWLASDSLERNLQELRQRSRYSIMKETRNSLSAPLGESPLSHVSGYRPRVLVVDDESTIADTITKILSLSGYSAMAAYDGDEALETALVTPPNLLITDVMLPGMNGIELAITIKRVYPECRVLLFSGQAATADLMTAARRDGYNFTLLSKPMPPKDLLAVIAMHLNPGTGRQVAAVA